MPSTWFYITGTDSGFGLEAVKMLAAKKKNVFAGHFLDDTAPMLSALGSTVVPVKLDVTSDASVAAAAATITEHLKKEGGELGGVVNNAGLLFQNGPCEWTPLGNWQKMYDINVLGMVRVTNSVLPLLRKSEGRIINTASIAGRAGLPTQAAYCASKHAVEGYSESLRREVNIWGITVHIVEPGVFVQTALYKTYHEGIEKLWEGCTEEMKTAYGEEYKNALQKGASELSKLGNSDASVVPKAYVHALLSDRPQYRYRLGKDSKIEITILSWLPESWQDALVRSKAKPLIPARSSKAALNRGLARYAGGGFLRNIVLMALIVLGIKLARKYIRQ